MSEAAAGMAAAAAPMAEARLRRKQLLSAEEAELFELAQAAGSGLDPEVFRVLLDLLRMNVAPLAVFQVLKSMCAGQRLPPGPEGGPAAPIPADTRGLSLDVWLLRQQGTDTGRKELCIAGVRMLSCPGKLSQTPVPVGKATEPITSHGLCQRFPGCFQNVEGLSPVVLKGTGVCVYIPGLRTCPLSGQMLVRRGRTFTWGHVWDC
ncbi:uncharacterized protein LOC116450310 isoform X1 [Corvus moneduloides]|uniref:uncharacterized protein LOC116450310 isoform X1 n=1 Tax=Corvus moneduloides TaxID=1196302 RepID=UPI0013632616|nr:uncharacterized protein LOC116450310 isoform X1 [Corvus moneduloides]